MVECWKCPKNTIRQCKHEEKYCNRYYVAIIKDSYMPDTNKEIEEVRSKENLFWKSEETNHVQIYENN